MTSEEFTEWSVMFNAEEMHPSSQRMRHAQLVAALHNGSMPRVDKKRLEGRRLPAHAVGHAGATNPSGA
jgi:hypothetical protein